MGSLTSMFQLLAFWPVWMWYGSRLTDHSDDRWGLITLLTALFFVACQKHQTRASLLLPSLLTIVYALSYHFLSPLPRAIIAVTAIAATLSSCCLGSSLHLGVYGLLLLSLPLMASLQFYLGYPLRSSIASIAAPMLQLGGLPVVSEGTSLNWSGKLVLIDAPCSGIKMLWTGLYLAFTLASYYKLSGRRTLLAAVMSVIAIIFGNLFRATALFYLESGILPFPAWTHEAAGAVSFLIIAIMIALLVKRLQREKGQRVRRSRGQRSSLISLFLSPLVPLCSFPSFFPSFKDKSYLFATCCILAVIAPLIKPQHKVSADSTPFPGWPVEFEGRALTPLPLSEREKRFTEGFPGKVARFTDGSREIIIRWVTRETRLLHPASDCFRGMGYSIHPLPVRVDAVGLHWGSFSAERDGDNLRVYERIYAMPSDPGWTDASSWYWNAAMGRTAGPWWAMTVAEH